MSARCPCPVAERSPTHLPTPQSPPWAPKDESYPESCVVPSPSHAPLARCSSSQAENGRTTGSVSSLRHVVSPTAPVYVMFTDPRLKQCRKVDGSRQMCSWRLLPRVRLWKKVLPFVPLSVSSPPDSRLPSLSLALLRLKQRAYVAPSHVM